jgi:hypothetical protein
MTFLGCDGGCNRGDPEAMARAYGCVRLCFRLYTELLWGFIEGRISNWDLDRDPRGGSSDPVVGEVYVRTFPFQDDFDEYRVTGRFALSESSTGSTRAVCALRAPTCPTSGRRQCVLRLHRRARGRCWLRPSCVQDAFCGRVMLSTPPTPLSRNKAELVRRLAIEGIITIAFVVVALSMRGGAIFWGLLGGRVVVLVWKYARRARALGSTEVSESSSDGFTEWLNVLATAFSLAAFLILFLKLKRCTLRRRPTRRYGAVRKMAAGCGPSP